MAPGASVSVSHSVTLLPTAWGHTLRNVTTPVTAGGTCPVVDDCATIHPVPSWSLSEVSNPPDGTTVQTGTNVTYTLTADQHLVGGGDRCGGRRRHVEGAGECHDRGGTAVDTVLAITNFAWFAPMLQPGGSASISYAVRINDSAFNATLTNAATPEANAGGVCVNACSTTTRTDGAAVEPPTLLPVTGAQAIEMLQWGAMLLAADLLHGGPTPSGRSLATSYCGGVRSPGRRPGLLRVRLLRLPARQCECKADSASARRPCEWVLAYRGASEHSDGTATLAPHA